MKNQPTVPEADLQGIPEPASFFFASAVANYASAYLSKGMEGKLRAIHLSKA
jgi:hypothetical protein